MIPSILSQQINQGLKDFLSTTFHSTNPFFHGMLERFLEENNIGPVPTVSTLACQATKRRKIKEGEKFFAPTTDSQDLDVKTSPRNASSKMFTTQPGCTGSNVGANNHSPNSDDSDAEMP